MTEFQLTTDVGTAVATAASDADDIQILVNGEIPETYAGLRTDTAKECAGGVVALSPEYNTYVVTPTAGDTISFDAGNIPGCRFKLLLDCTAGAVSFSFADNFKWTGATPVLTDKGLHGLDVVQVSVNGISAFLGTYLGIVSKSLDPNKGVIVYRDGVISEDECGEEFNSLYISAGGWDDNFDVIYEDVKVYVQDGANVRGQLSVFVDDGGLFELNVRGGTIGGVTADQISGDCMFKVDAGTVGSIDIVFASGNFDCVVNGGTIGYASFSTLVSGSAMLAGGRIDELVLSEITTAIELTGAAVGSCNLHTRGGLAMSSGSIETVSMDGVTPSIWVVGGSIGLIETTASADTATISLDSCTVGQVRPYLQSESDPRMTIERTIIGELWMHKYANHTVNMVYAPNIGSGCMIEKLCFETDASSFNDVRPFSFSVGANSVVKLDRTMQELVTLGIVTINADPTATIINLGN